MPDPSSTTPDRFSTLKAEFRHHLERFYAGLQLAPPYESVEKAIRTLTTMVHGLSIEEQTRLMADSGLRWQQFRLAFEASGLPKKHRGIIAGLARNRSALNLPAEYDHFLNLFLA
ncbi:MAG: hypothetical protein A4E19_11875 [Nitrospira sp. SG-bin1]|nr:MAG: hypothetical protein A4E19_11875 [Nitrospira sp. SG-bin1]